MVAPSQPGSIVDSILDDAHTLPRAISALVEQRPDRECLIFLDRERGEQPLTLRQFWSRAKDVQAAVQGRGLQPGECVVVALPTSAELLAAYFGVMLAGGVPSLVSTPVHRFADRSTYARMVGNVLQNADARFLYGDDDVASRFEGPEREQLGDTRILRPADVTPCGTPPETRLMEPGDVATIQYSSGTTGPQKGVMLSHRAMLAYMRSLRDGLRITSEDVSVNWLPLYHDMGLFGAFLQPLLCGCRTVLIPTMDFLRDPAVWLRTIDRYRGTLSWAPNFAFTLCTRRIADDEIAGIDLSSWRTAASASEPVLPATLAAFAERFAPYGYRPETMAPAWGLAEAVMAATIDAQARAPWVETVDRQRLAAEGRAVPKEGGLPLVAVGSCLPGFELEIRDAERRALGDRRVGDIWLRGEALFEGYRKDPELTAEILVDGWMKSGDRGYVANGQLVFVSRGKDLILIGGENHVPHDVESAINRVPGVREGCAVAFGVMNEERGTEDLAAVVESRVQGEEDLADLRRAIRTEVMRSVGIAIRHLKIVPPGGVEKTTSGKLARQATRRRYSEEFGSDT